MQGGVIKLSLAAPPAETIRVLEHLLHEARAGRIVGFACVAMYKVDDYVVDVTDTCKRWPHLTRGMVATLDDELSRMLPGNGPGEDSAA